MAADEKSLYQKVNDYFYEDKVYGITNAYEVDNYKILPLQKSYNFIYFAWQQENELFEDISDDPAIGKSVRQNGLKFHVSIPEWDQDLYNRSFDLLIPLLMKQGVDFKFLKSGHKMSDQKGQAGKDITIYASARPDKNLGEWEKLIYDITIALVQSKIQPGYKVVNNAKKEYLIDGCNYISYRYENETTKKRIRPNPDPITKFKINIPNQMLPTLYQNAEEGTFSQRVLEAQASQRPQHT